MYKTVQRGAQESQEVLYEIGFKVAQVGWIHYNPGWIAEELVQKCRRQESSAVEQEAHCGYKGVQKPSWRSSQILQIEAWHSYSYTYLIPDHEAH